MNKKMTFTTATTWAETVRALTEQGLVFLVGCEEYDERTEWWIELTGGY